MQTVAARRVILTASTSASTSTSTRRHLSTITSSITLPPPASASSAAAASAASPIFIKMPAITYSILKEQNASTSNAIIEHLKENPSFQRLAKFEGDSTVKRDNEDDSKLAKGIAFAQQKGVLDPKHVPQPYTQIDVLGKTPEEVATTIITQVQEKSKETNKTKGSVVVLCGLSGTGKVSRQLWLQLQLERNWNPYCGFIPTL